MKSQPRSLAEIIDGTINAKPRVYHGVEFRSTLEARFAIHLDGIGVEWVYEPRVYGPSGRGYLPDFQIVDAQQPTFIEVKPTLAEVGDAKTKMSVIWDTHPDALLMVACQEGRYFYASLGRSRWRSWQERWAA